MSKFLEGSGSYLPWRNLVTLGNDDAPTTYGQLTGLNLCGVGPGPFSAIAGSYVAATRRLTLTTAALARYALYADGDVLLITSSSLPNFPAGRYPISARVSASVLELATSAAPALDSSPTVSGYVVPQNRSIDVAHTGRIALRVFGRDTATLGDFSIRIYGSGKRGTQGGNLQGSGPLFELWRGKITLHATLGPGQSLFSDAAAAWSETATAFREAVSFDSTATSAVTGAHNACGAVPVGSDVGGWELQVPTLQFDQLYLVVCGSTFDADLVTGGGVAFLYREISREGA